MASAALVPNGPFPIQLKQAILALEHLLASGVQPQNIQIIGDSAGAGLILQLLSHILHPIDAVPPLVLPSRIGGFYLMSPWVSLTGDTGSHAVNDKSDVISAKTLGYWGRSVLVDVPESQNAYVEAVKAPEEWFKGADGVVKRVLITAGAAECLRDDIVQFADVFKKHHPDVEVVVQKGGVHDDPYYDFSVKESKLGELTPLIVKWFAEGFDS